MTFAETAVSRDRMNSKVGKFLELPRVGVTEKSQWRCSRLQSQGLNEDTTRATFKFYENIV